ncbi:hypothetical protein JZU57_00755, partial [bacterium]|nr:hypothetical protein [bacterium]
MKTPFEATERSTSTVARAFLPLLLLLSLFAHAGENDALRLSGFGTLGYAQDDRHDMAALRDLSQKPKDGFK